MPSGCKDGVCPAKSGWVVALLQAYTGWQTQQPGTLFCQPSSNPAVAPLVNGPPTRLFHGYYSPLCQKYIVSWPALSFSSQYPSHWAFFLQPAPSLFNFFMLLQKPHSLWHSETAGSIFLSVLEVVLPESSLMFMHQNWIKLAWCLIAYLGEWFQGE